MISTDWQLIVVTATIATDILGIAAGIDIALQSISFGEVELFGQVSDEIPQLVLAVTLGMFLGLEREWSQKNAGIRTFALTGLLGAILAITEQQMLLVAGALLVITMGVLLAVQGLVDEEEQSSLSLTTSTSLFVAYGLGVLVVYGYYIESVTVAVLSLLLLILKRELHEFAWRLSRDEMQSAAEFAVLAFVIYPLLPNEAFGPWNAIDAKTIWLLVIAVSGIGFINYILVKRYEGRGMAATGFFGGLVNSTAVIAEMSQRAASSPKLRNLAVGSILLANAAMAFRNAIIVIPFMPEMTLIVGIPLGAITVSGIALSIIVSDLDQSLETDLTSPFSLRNALVFGVLFLIILVVSSGSEAIFGSAGFLVTTFLAGLVSSGTATATAITLVGTDQISQEMAVSGILVGTFASIVVKVFFAASIDRSLIRPVLLSNAVLIIVGALTGAGAIFVL